MKSIKSNAVLLENIRALRKAWRSCRAGIWAALAEQLEANSRNKVVVNLSRLNRSVREGEVVAVPGKVLGAGKVGHAMTVAAFEFSATARRRIEEGGGKPMTIMELLRQNPKGLGVKLVR